MNVAFSNDIILDSRRAIFMPQTKTLVMADFFLGLGAARRRRPDLMPESLHHDLWERLLGLLQEYQPSRVALLGDVKPNQGSVEGDEAEELHMVFQKLHGRSREVVQVTSHPERSWGPAMEGTGIQPVDLYRVGNYTLMHRRRIFVYPRHDPPQGFWINGGMHPLFAKPITGTDGKGDWLRYPAYLFTGFALVMPPFVSYAQGWEVMQAERLPKQAHAWKLLGNQLQELSLSELTPPPEAIRTLARNVTKRKNKTKEEFENDEG